MNALQRIDAAALLGGGFLSGLAVHSLWPYAPLLRWVLIGLIVGIPLFLLFSDKKLRIAGLLILAISCGVWRFDVARPRFPEGLRAVDPQGFFYQQEARAGFFKDARERINKRISAALPGDEGALLAGMLYGERGLSKEAKQRFRDAGLTHLIAVSGSNVTLLVFILMRILSSAGLRRRTAFIGLSIAIVFFVLFVGPQASVVRAAIMGWLIEFAPLVGRMVRPSRLLLVAAVLFSFFQPAALVFDPGFALSFLATAGLLTWGSWLDMRLENLLPWKTIREIVSATLGATVMTMPYIAWAFGQVSVIGLAANILAVPLTPWIMLLGILFLLAPSITLLALPVQGFLSAVLWVSRLPERIGFGTWDNVVVSYAFLFISYACIWMIWRHVKQRNAVFHNIDEGIRPFLS